MRPRRKHGFRPVLLAVAALCGGCFRAEKPGQARPAAFDTLRFEEAGEKSGLRFRHEAGNRGRYFMRESMGSGAALFDYNNDGRLDVYLLSGRPKDTIGEDTRNFRNRLFRQDSGMRFTDVTDSARAYGNGFAMGVGAADFDGDGFTDLYVSNYGRDSYFRNNGDGGFSDRSAQAGLKDTTWGTSVAVLDYDKDGHPDVFVAVYGSIADTTDCRSQTGSPDYCGPEELAQLPGLLLHNDGQGHFEDRSAASGVAARGSNGLGAIPLDVDEDGWMDLYVANDGLPNFLWVNQRDGTFKEEAMARGAAVNSLGAAEAGMGIAVGDADGDGYEDLYITHLRTQLNRLYRSQSASRFYDATRASGAAERSLPYTGFGDAFFDMDLDGDLDLAVVNGRVTRWDPLVKSDPPSYWDAYAEPKLLYENIGVGRFREVSGRAPGYARFIENGRALAVGDVDNDGRPDLLVGNEGGPARLFLNRIPPQGDFVTLTLLDTQGRMALGARVDVLAPSQFRSRKTCRVSSGYLTSNDPRLHFGLPSPNGPVKARVRWPDGRGESFPDLALNQFHTLRQGKGAPENPESRP